MWDTLLITQVFAKMEEIQIGWEAVKNVTKFVIDAALQRPNNLKKLWCFGAGEEEEDISWDPVLFASALNKVEVLNLRLTDEEANLLFEMMQGESSVRNNFP